MLKIYNSLLRDKQQFTPINAGKVGLYVCGITVYDHCHLGHARTAVSFDMIVRYLRASGYEVNYVRNITDIDDKIIIRAAENNEDYQVLTERMINAMHADYRALNLLEPNSEPRATAHIGSIIALITRLIDSGHAYVADNGDVYFNVTSYEKYGELSRKDLDGQVAGARVDVVESKQSSLDFVLWKQAKDGEPAWSSPWGDGRPGWHIECSAMSMECLGDTFDIHGGGFDLQFPHHENEIAQSEAATGQCFANIWAHVGFLQINKEKMSKSLDNFFTIRDVLTSYHPEVIRYFLLSSHYRSQLNYSDDNLNAAKNSLERLYQSLSGLSVQNTLDLNDECYLYWRKKFDLAMNDDFNTPEAFAVLFELSHEVNRQKKSNVELSTQLATCLKSLAGILGLLELAPEDYLQSGVSDDSIEEINAMVLQRIEARENKNWALADSLRDKLNALGIELLDGGKEGTQWRKK